MRSTVQLSRHREVSHITKESWKVYVTCYVNFTLVVYGESIEEVELSVAHSIGIVEDFIGRDN